MNKLITKGTILSVVLTTLLCAFLCPVIAHAATGNGHISGRLLDGTNNNAPLANQTVTLQVAQGDNTSDLSSTSTDTNGAFSFAHLSTDKTLSYAVYMRYQGAQYVSDVVSLADKPEQQVNLTVYEATQSTDKIAVLQSTTLLHADSLKTGFLSVSAVYNFTNLDKKAYVGSLDASHGMPNTLRFGLPAGVKNISLGKGFSGYKVIQVDKGFATDAALLPGNNNEFSFSYEIPYSGSSYDFNYKTIYPTVSALFLVATDLHASADGLQANGIVNTNSHPYKSYLAKALVPNQELKLSLQGLPTKQNNTQGSFALDPVVVWIIVLLVVMALIVAGTGYLYYTQRYPKSRPAMKKRRGNATSSTSATSVSKTNNADRKQALLRELLQLDKDYAAGKMSKSVYEERRGKTKARLRVIMSEQETSRK